MRRIYSIILALALILGAVPITAQAAEPDSYKIDTTGVIVSDSGNYGSSYVPENTIDGDYGTRWAAIRPNGDYRGSFYLYYQFPQAEEIAQIKFYELSGNDGNRISDVVVSISDDGQSWNEVQTFSNLKDNNSDTESFVFDEKLETQYVKLEVKTALRDENGVMRQGEPNVCEVEFYSEVQPDPVTLKYYDITKESVKLYLPDMTGIESYDVYQADAALDLTIEDMTKINPEPATESEYQVTGLNAGSEYRFMIRAELEDGRITYSNQVNVPTAKQLSGTGLESGEGVNLKMPYSSLALNMEYKGPVLSDPGWFNWCLSPIKGEDGKYHLFSARWLDTMWNWAERGQIIHSVSDNPEGPYEFKEVILTDPELLNTVEESQRDAVISDLPGHAPHNCRIKKVGDQYALTFILQTDDGQKIALLVSDSVNGPWKWAGGEKGFVVEPSDDSEHWTYGSVLGTDNHDIIKIGDEYRIYFKAGRGQNETMHYGYAYSSSLEGPYTLSDEPALSENKNYIEDGTVFEWNDAVYLLTTDNFGTNTGVLGYGILWKSNDGGKTFKYSDAKIGFGLMSDYIKWPVTGAVDVYNGQTAKFERPAILMGDDGNPEYFFGTLGMNLDGNYTTENFLLKINWQPGSLTDILSIAGESLDGLTGDGTIADPLTGRIELRETDITIGDIISSGDQKELYLDSGFTEKVPGETVTVEAGKDTRLYIKITAEDGSEAYYDITVTGLPSPLSVDVVSISDNGNYGQGYGPENTLDGSLDTRWAALRPSDDYDGDFYLTYEFAQDTTFNMLKVYEMADASNGNRIKTITVQSSEDGIDWKDAGVFDGLKDNGQDTETLELEEALTTRYLRLVFSTVVRPEDWNRLAEPNVSEVEFYMIAEEGPSEPVSKKTLEYFLNQAKGYMEDGSVDSCVESVQKLFEEAVAEGEAVMTDENATREEVTNAAAKLMFAIQALDLKAGDKTDLEMAVELGDMIDLTKYVEAGQAEFTEALAKAKEVLADGDAFQDDIDSAWDALVDAIANLRLKADKSVLQDLISQMTDLDLTGYTEESASVFRSALSAANDILADETLSVDDQAKVDEAVSALQAAYDGLEKTGGTDPENPGGSDTGDTQNPGSSQSGNDGQSAGENTSGQNNKADGSVIRVAKTGDSAPIVAAGMALVLSAGAALLVMKKRSRR